MHSPQCNLHTLDILVVVFILMFWPSFKSPAFHTVIRINLISLSYYILVREYE